jgi:L-iditol 2-dehydrogenase
MTAQDTPPRHHRRAVQIAPRSTHIETMPGPAEPGPNQILVQVLINGVCASELPAWQRGPDGHTPLTLGHEPVGRVLATGPDVEAPAVGDLVTGRFPRSFADLVVARADDAVVVPPGLPIESAIGEPLGCIVDALRRSQVDLGDRVAVIGLGYMGLCLLQLLHTSSVGELIAIDPRDESRQHALAHGATAAHPPQGVLTATGTADSFDIVFEVTGAQAGLDLATRLTRPHGTLTIVGYHQGPRQIDMQAWNWKALDVVNGHVRSGTQLADSTRRGLELVANGRIDYASLITHRYPLDHIDDAFQDFLAKPAGFIKAVITLDN